MGGRISNKVSPMKEYGRKPYLVTPTTVPLGEEADYRYMMDKTWQKAQDDAHIVVQSVKKKPYQEQDYQSMENTADGYTNIDWHFTWNWYRPKFSWRAGQNNTTTILEPEDPDREEERKVDGVLRWTQCPTTVSPSKSYTIIVRNSYITTRQYTNGRLRNTQTETIPSQISIVPKTSAAKGLSITYVKDMGGSTRATLQTSSYATGEFYVYATDGKNTIQKTISAATGKASTIVFRRNYSAPFQYYKLEDLILGNETPYTVFTTQSGILMSPNSGSLTYTLVETMVTPYIYHGEHLKTLTLSSAGSVLASTIYDEYISFNTMGDDTTGFYYGKDARKDGEDVVCSEYIYFGDNIPRTLSIWGKHDFLSTGFYASGTKNNYNYYCKFSGVSLTIISADYSIYATVTEPAINLYYQTGMNLAAYKLVDANSYVVVGQYWSAIGTSSPYVQAEYYHASGIFSGSAFSINLSWYPTILFGSL